jgi:hypothetical protein
MTYLPYNLYLALEASCPALNQGNIGRQAHLVDVPPSLQIIQGIEDDIEPLKPIDVELGVFNIGMVRFECHVGVEFCGGLFGDLVRRAISLRCM